MPEMDYEEAVGIARHIAENPHAPDDTSIGARQAMVTTLLYERASAAEKAKRELTRILEMNPGSSWDDIVYYAGKAKGSLRISNQTIRRRTAMLNAVLGLPEDVSWPKALSEVRKYHPVTEGE